MKLFSAVLALAVAHLSRALCLQGWVRVLFCCGVDLVSCNRQAEITRFLTCVFKSQAKVTRRGFT